MDHPPISSRFLVLQPETLQFYFNSPRQKVQGCRLCEAVFFNCKKHKAVLTPGLFYLLRCLIIMMQRTFLILGISLKRNQALPESNLPAIRLMDIRYRVGCVFRPTFLVYRYPLWLKKLISFFMLLFLFDKAIRL